MDKEACFVPMTADEREKILRLQEALRASGPGGMTNELMQAIKDVGASGTYDLAFILSEMLLRVGVSIHITGGGGGGGKD